MAGEPTSTSPATNLPREMLETVAAGVPVLLINIAAYDYSFSPFRCMQQDRRPPVGLHVLQASAAAVEETPPAAILDMESHRLAPSDVGFLIGRAAEKSTGQLVVGLNGYSPNRYLVEKVLHAVRQAAPAAFVVLGGRMVSIELDTSAQTPVSLQESILGNAAAEGPVCAMIGEGEKAFTDLIRHRAGWGYDDLLVESVGVGTPAGIRPPRKADFVDANGLESEEFHTPPQYRATGGNGAMYYAMLSSRSCPYKCSFCAANYFPVRIRAIDALEQDIRALARHRRGPLHIDFLDDNVFQSPDRGRAIIEMMERIGTDSNEIIWRVLARGDTLVRLAQTGHLERARNAGLEEVAVGLETTSDRLLKAMTKGATFRSMDSGINLLTAAGIRAKLFAMIGIPDETEAEMNHTIHYLKQRAAIGDRWSLFVAAPYAGTADHRALMNAGWSFWDLQLYTEAAARGGGLVEEVGRCGIQLSRLPLSELFDLIKKGTDLISSADAENPGEDCCAVAYG
jgi:hypothetical protein